MKPSVWEEPRSSISTTMGACVRASSRPLALHMGRIPCSQPQQTGLLRMTSALPQKENIIRDREPIK